MASGITVKVELHPMYIDFIRHDMCRDEKKRVFASTKHPIGLLLKNLLRNRPQNCLDDLTANGPHVEFVLPDYTDINNEYKNYLSENGRRMLVKKIKSHFYYELHEFIVEMKTAGVPEMRSIVVLFCEQHEIDEDNYKVNTLEREYARYRNKQEKVKKMKKLSSAFSLFLSLFCPLSVHLLSELSVF